MTDEGIIKCFGVLQGAYQNFYSKTTANDWSIMKDVWKVQFEKCEDLPVFAALHKSISTCEFPPSIATIKKNMLGDDETSEEDVWSLMLKAGRNGIYGAQEEWEKLPEDLKPIVTPATIKEIALADDESIRFIKKDVLANYRDRKAKQTDKLLSTGTMQLDSRRLLE